MKHKRISAITKKQKKYTEAICKLYNELHPLVLLQLPTGFGKTRVAVNVLDEIIKNNGSPIWISCPKQIDHGNIKKWVKNSNTWKKELYDKFPCEIDRNNRFLNSIKFISHQKLSRTLFTLERKRDKNLKEPPRIIIIDEVHRCTNLINILNHKELHNKKILLLSATPVNPVRINDVALLEDDSDEEMRNDIQTGYKRLYVPILKYLGHRESKLAKKLEQKAKDFDKFVEIVKKANDEILPVPSADALIKDFKERLGAKSKYQKNDYFCWQKQDNHNIQKYLSNYIRFQEINYCHNSKQNRLHRNLMAVSERIAISGYQCAGKTTLGNKDKKGSSGSAKRVYKILHQTKHKSVYLNYKIDTLIQFLNQHFALNSKKSKVLIYCSYLDTVKWLCYRLNSEKKIAIHPASDDNPPCGFLQFPATAWSTETWSTTKKAYARTRKEEKALNFFNENLTEKECCKNCGQSNDCGRILITSDRCSESIDLHRRCNIVIHFDLDWSPIRIMQRVGRLWRIGAYNAKNTDYLITFPNVYHLKHPCSIDEEIYFRLKRRWKMLEKMGLGLDYMPFHIAVGNDLHKIVT